MMHRAALAVVALLLAGCGDWRDVPPAERGFFGSIGAWVTGADVARQAAFDAEAAAAEARAEQARARAAAAEAEAARSSAALAAAEARRAASDMAPRSAPVPHARPAS